MTRNGIEGLNNGEQAELDGLGKKEPVVSSVDEEILGCRCSSDVGVDLLAQESPLLGLEHCNSAPVQPNNSLLVKDHEQPFFRSKTYKREAVKCDLKLDRLSESEKKKIIENLIKIQKDGTVEVDVAQSAPVATELLELDAVDTVSFHAEETVSEFRNSVPKLKITMLVVGTRGDVQPFIAFAKRLQEYGHHVRLATHTNFRTFVRSFGVDFYPLGGDPRIMAGYMAKNKGFLLSGPSEISIQRKQLKEIINSLLPACTEPDLESGAPFRAQAIIANPPAYGHVHVAEALGVPLHIFFTMPWTPTHEFPHPLARVPQSAAYRLSYLVVDLIIWWGIRGYINEFRKRKLKLPPIAYFNTYRGSIAHLPTGYMWSPHLVPKPDDWGVVVDVVGFCFLNLSTRYQPQKEFSQWIQQGPKPIYIGFGSMCPTTIIPFFGDQFFWGERVHARGVGPSPIPISQLTVEQLSNAIRFMLDPEIKLRVMELARLMENEDGVAVAVDAFHRHLPPVLPLPPACLEELPNPLHWLFLLIEKWCCLPFKP